MAKPADSREVNGRAVCGPRLCDMLEDKSRRLGRGREEARAGDPGSFFTLIDGGAPLRNLSSIFCQHMGQRNHVRGVHSRARRSLAIRNGAFTSVLGRLVTPSALRSGFVASVCGM